GITERREETAGGGNHERQQHRRARMLSRDIARDDEDAGADGGADADQSQMHWPQRAMQLDFVSHHRVYDPRDWRFAHAATPPLRRRGWVWHVWTNRGNKSPARSPSRQRAAGRYRRAGMKS